MAEGQVAFEEKYPNEMREVCEDCYWFIINLYPPELFTEDRAAGIQRVLDRDENGQFYMRRIN